MDKRRRRWIVFDSMFFASQLADGILERFGPTGITVWVAFLCACKRNLVPGQITVAGQEDTLAQLGLHGLVLVDSAGDNWELDAFWTYLGRMKHVRRRRHGRRQDVIATRWEQWQNAPGHKGKPSPEAEIGEEVPPDTPADKESFTETDTTDSPKSPQGGDQHDGRHQNCRQCGTNQRAQPKPPIAPVELVIDPNPACPTCRGTGQAAVTPGVGSDGYERCACTYYTPDEGVVG